MCFIKSRNLLQTNSNSQEFRKPVEKVETELQTKVKLEENSQQKYIVRLDEGFIVLYPLLLDDSEELKRFYLDFDVKMSTIEKLNNSFNAKSQKQISGIKLQNSEELKLSLYFRTPSQVHVWMKKLSLYVNQLNFQKHFKVIRKLGKGASASVYQARKLENGKRFAVKVFSKQSLTQGRQKLQSLKKQVDILRDLSAQNIVDFEGVFEDEKAYYLVMELIRGVNIFDFLLNQKAKLQTPQIKQIIRNILKNLLALEELDIVHRDIKLQNIIVDSITLKTNIIDYGLAVYAEEDDYIFYNCGTPGYISPETFNSRNNGVTTKSDIFSAGVILHILLTGQYLFAAQNIKDIMAKNMKMEYNIAPLKQQGVDQSALNLLEKMLSVKPEERFSAGECLSHQFLREQKSFDEDSKPDTPSTIEDIQVYQF